MQLVMFIGNDYVASVTVHSKQISVPGYLGKLKRQLMNENSQLLQNSGEEPEFLLANLATVPNPQGKNSRLST